MERVTKAFFDDYKEVFFKLRSELQKQRIPSKESHEFTLQFLNRIMFIYFISKKDWLEEPKFADWLWSKYRGLGKYNSNEFYEKWLKQVFLKAFNNRGNEIRELPDDVVKAISNAPYLNGGLFRENGLDSLKILITDKMFQKIIEFFESYNFTIKEDMPLESEVAVDPQMIGYVYESLANVAEEIYDRNDLGIFYTPRVEVDFMCRRSMVEYLSKNLAELPKEKFYHLIFDPAEEREKIEGWFTKNQHWRRLEDVLNNLSVVDPACGSGAFLVGMLNVVSDSYRMIYKHIWNSLSDFALKNRVIQYSLYGVDVMPWAIHAAELRLWLQLIVETEFKKEELRQHPLLPNLNLNLRVGDSLVQEIGGISFNLRTNNLKEHLKKKLEALKQEKRKYFENSPTAKFKSPEEVKEEEVRLFEEIIDERVESLTTDIQVFEHNIKMAESQKTLAGEQVINEKKVNENLVRIDTNKEEIEKLRNIKRYLNDPEKKPFVWDIDFAEIFAEKKGFDIVIGNPPYVRQEMISPPNTLKSEVTKEARNKYKEKLINSVKVKFKVIKNIDKRSDYFVYFYFHGLSLLNANGTFSFITSNSWLDVNYGKALQEFLCKYVPMLGIYDNPKRSFAHADINTVITFFGPPKIIQRSLYEWTRETGGGNEKTWPNIKGSAKFVMFRKPFEEALTSDVLIALENLNTNIKGGGITQLVKNVVNTNNYRAFPVMQEDLLEDGWEYPQGQKSGKFETGSYEGNKWGSKYLRAPDVFYTILEKGEGKLTTIGKITVKTQRNTLQNFSEYVELKENFEKNKNYPYLSSIKDTDTIKIDPKKLPNSIKKTTERKITYPIPDIISNRFFGDRIFFVEGGDFIVSDTFFVGFLKKEYVREEVTTSLNGTVSLMVSEIVGRKNLGGGLLTIYGPEMKGLVLLDPNSMSANLKLRLRSMHDKITKRKVESIFGEVGIDQSKPIREQEPNPLPDRAELDNMIFDELGLTQDERKEVYWSVCEMVKQRIDKARSLRD